MSVAMVDWGKAGEVEKAVLQNAQCTNNAVALFETMHLWRTRNYQTTGLRWLMAIVLLLPMFLEVLPSPVSAADVALYRDLQSNRCEAAGTPIQNEQHDCDYCLLCAAPGVPRHLATADPLAAPLRSLPQTAKVANIFLRLDGARSIASIAPITSRGPPA